jgi:hypothetical protein
MLPVASAQTLTHRYSFFNKANGSTTVVDSVGEANGSLVGAAVITGGQLVLSGASGCYANLPAGLITGYSAVTVEAWANYGTLPVNCYLFSFGNTDGSGDGEDYIFCAPQAARITISGVDPGYDGEQNASCGGWSGLTDLHVVAVFNPPLGYLALYTNGVLAATNNAETVPLSSVKDVYNYIGKSLYTSDPYAPIKVDEFRIWNGALNGLQAAADYLAGDTVTNANPGTVTNLQLRVASSMLQGAQQNAVVTAQTTEISRAVDITKFCSYSSDNTNVLALSGTGLIKGVGPGTAAIVAQYASVSATQFVTVTVPPAVMTHRYSFFSEANGSATAIDTVGSANGTLNGDAAITNGQLILNGATGTYLSLPANIITSAYSGATIEAWASFGALPVNCFFFGFGNTDSSGAGEDYIFCAPEAGRVAITGADPGYTGEQNAASGANWSGQTNLHIVAVFEPPAGYISLYTNGALAAINNAVTTPLSSVNDVDSYIGRSLYTADPYAPFNVEEFRIYNGPLTPQQIALDAASGPSQILTNPGALLSIQLEVTPMPAGATGQAVVLGNFANVSNVNLFTYGQPTVVSTNSSVLSVSASGLVTAVGPGSATIVATYGGLSVTNIVTVTGFATNRFVFDSFSDGFWTIVNQGNSNTLVASLGGASQEPYTNGAMEQQFEVLYNLQNATFRLRQRSSWYCIGASGNQAAPGAWVPLIASYTGASAQQWHIVDAGSGWFRIFNAASNLVLQTDNETPAHVTLAAPAADPFQLWQFNYQTHYPKKGSAGYEGPPYSTELTTSWAYNYDDNTSASEPASFDFAPMVWGPYWEPVSDLQSRDPGWLASPKPSYLLTFNEPDNSSQADMSTNTAISMWPSLEALNVPLVGPATQNTEDAWENGFYELIANNNYRVDYAAAHEYVPPNAASLISDLNSVYTAYGRPVWLTEFSPVDWSDCQCWSEDDDYNFLAEFMWQAESLEWIKRYAIFPFSNTNPDSPWVDNGFTGSVFLSNGQTLSPYGELYATWDGNLTLQAVTPYIIHNLATSFRLTATNGVSKPLASTIYVRNATTEWALLASPTPNNWYVISLNDGRRLSYANGALDLSPFGTVGTTVQWTFTGPDSSGYYFIANPTAGLNLYASGTAPAISFSAISSSTETDNTRWRLVKPYQPVSIPAAAAPAGLSSAPGDGTVTLSWTASAADHCYNVYRSTVSGGPYTPVASLLTNAMFTDNAVVDGVPYYYVVTGLNILGQESSYSAQIAAQPVSLNPPLVSFGMTTNGIQFNWPSVNTGWELQAQTNSLGANWVTLSETGATNQVIIPIDPANSTVFYRLVYP